MAHEKKRIKSDQWESTPVTVLVAYMDIRGFGSFLRRVSNPEIELLPFRQQWHNSIDGFKTRTRYYVKKIGDGILVVFETTSDDSSYDAVCFINNLWDLMTEMKALIKKKPSPRPSGVVVRGIYGGAWKEPCVEGLDYISDKINLAERMIHQHKEVCFVIHESLEELLPASLRRSHKFEIKKLPMDSRVAENGVYEDDMKYLSCVSKKTTGRRRED